MKKSYIITFSENGFQSLDTNGLVELGLWVSRVLFDICGMISVQCLYTRWKLEQQTAEIVASSVSYPANTYMIPGKKIE